MAVIWRLERGPNIYSSGADHGGFLWIVFCCKQAKTTGRAAPKSASQNLLGRPRHARVSPFAMALQISVATVATRT